MEIKINKEQTMEQISKQMYAIVERFGEYCVQRIMADAWSDAEDLLRDDTVQKALLQYERLICLIESVSPMRETLRQQADFFSNIHADEPAVKQFERLIHAVAHSGSAGMSLAAFHAFVPDLLKKMREEKLMEEAEV